MAFGPIRLACVLFRTFIAAALVWVAFSASADDQVRVALVLGNSEYEHVSKLPNPASDAQDIGAAFERIGFTVTTGFNLDYNQMRLVLWDFAEDAADADVVIIYFAGHGIEIDNTNYLIPVNAQLKSDRDVDFEAIRLDSIVDAIADAPGLKIVLVDACRNNPFLVDMTRTSASRNVGRGLGRIDPSGVLVGYAARGGTLALDGEGRNSPYAQALLQHVEEPGLEIGKLFRKVRDTVYELTDGAQEPFTYGSLPGEDIYLVSAPAALEPIPEPPAPQVATPQAGAPSEDDLCAQAMVAWSLIYDSESRTALERFAAKFKDCPSAAEVAAARIAALGSGPPAIAKAPSEPEKKTEVAASPSEQDAKPTAAATPQVATGVRETTDYANKCLVVAGYETVPTDTVRKFANKAIAACTTALNQNPYDARVAAALARAFDAKMLFVQGKKYWTISAQNGFIPAIAKLERDTNPTAAPDPATLMANSQTEPEVMAEANTQTEMSFYERKCLLLADPKSVLVASIKSTANAAISACATALNHDPKNGRIAAALARAYDAKSLYSLSHKYWKVAAENGHMDAITEVRKSELIDYVKECNRLADYETVSKEDLKANEAAALSACTNAYEQGASGRAAATLARVYYARENYSRSFQYWKISAESGYPPAMAELGFIYKCGCGTKIDLKEAARWYRLAAEAGSVYGMEKLGDFLLDGSTGTVDAEEAFQWHLRAATANAKPYEVAALARTMNDVGVSYENGRGVKKDIRKAFEWYMRSAQAGDSYGMNNSAIQLQYGEGTTKDLKLAKAWFTRAAEAGNTYAMENLSFLMAEQSDPDVATVTKWMVKCLEVDKDCADRLNKRFPWVPSRYKKALQEALRDRGHYTGKIDGVPGPATLAAMRAVSKDQ